MSELPPTEVLLVEDNPHDRELTLRALQKGRLVNVISVAVDGADALDYLFGEGKYEGRDNSRQPGVVLLDLKLPKLSGLEVLERMRANRLTRKTPVVILTSSNEDADIVKAYELGVNSYIVKPVEFERFTEAVREVGLYWLLLNKAPGG